MSELFFHPRRQVLANLMINGLRMYSRALDWLPLSSPPRATTAHFLPENPQHPEDFRPLENACFQNPYRFYRMLRDRYPIYELPNGVYCVSRYQDIVDISRDVDTFSSTHQSVVASLGKHQDLLKAVSNYQRMSALGIAPADVLATADPPAHTEERKLGHAGFNAHVVKDLEPRVETLCRQMMDKFIPSGQVEFMQEFGWRMPMILVIRLLGLPEQDFQKIKTWCVNLLNIQNGIQTASEQAISRAEGLTFMDYCWQQYRRAKRHPRENLMSMFAKAASNPATDFDDKKAVSAIFQLLIAGSDSSATSMGNALKMLIENPQLQEELRAEPEKIAAFIEEVFRLESAFQGHFRWTKCDTECQGVPLPKGSRLFLMWASGNRDERFWEHPDQIILNRKNGKKHLTFGHGIHACLGRELARLEIKVVLREFLRRTRNLRIVGETPYIASMFARTLVQLPIRFDPVINTHHSVAV